MSDTLHSKIYEGTKAGDFLALLREYRAEIETDLFDRFKRSLDQEEWPGIQRMLIGIEAFERWAVKKISGATLAQVELDDIIKKQELQNG